MSKLRLYWLGHPRIELSGSPLRLETRKICALLAYLSLHENPQSREKLAALFWPDFDQVRAPANLRRGLASLHASIPGDWLVAERDSIGLRREGDLEIDVLELRGLVEGLKTHLHDPAEPCPVCLDLSARALRLYQGEFLEGFNLPDCPDFDDWQRAERESLRAELGWLLERSARTLAASGQWEEALRTARRWLAQDRMHEPAQELLIRILSLSGQRSAALRQYDDYAETLRREYGQEPEEGTRQLHEQILARAQRPAARCPDSPLGLLATKLSVPPLREGRVRRARLIGLLERGLGRGLVLVSAPAGFGKTTILSELAAQAGRPIAWLSLDEGDNDAQRLLLHLSAAIERTDEGMGREAGQMLQAMPPAPAEAVMTALINAIQDSGKGIALVLDDCQFLQSPEVHTCLRFLIEHRPASLVLLIATREDPPLPLARLRSQDRVAEIRAEDLRFTPAEAAEFFDRAMSLSLSEAQIAALEKRTEGWVAGLQMAALSLRGREDVDGFLASFGGTHRYIMEYLVEEVFSRLDGELKAFLLDTSILGRMSAGLCEAVTGRGGGQEILGRLERMNLFLVPLDEERTWYRYHHLFAELLKHRLEHEGPQGRIQALHARAGQWFAMRGELIDAMQEYLAARAYEEAANLIEARFYDLMSQGALSQLQVWCREMPSELMEGRAGYSVAAAWTLAWSGRALEAEALLDRVERRIPEWKTRATESSAGGEDESLRNLEGSVAIIRALIAEMAGKTAESLVLARKAQTLLAPKDDLPGTVIFYILQKSYFYEGELDKAEEGCLEFLRASYATGSIWSISAAVCELARLRSYQGRPHEAMALIEEFDALVQSRRARGIGPIAKAYALMAEYKRERGELDEALRIAEKAARDVDQWGLPSDVYITHQFLSRVYRSRGELERARAELEKVSALPRKTLVWDSLLPSFESDRIKVLLASGDIASAQAWAREAAPGQKGTVVNREIELVSLARIRLAAGAQAGEGAELLSLLEGLASSAREGGRVGPLIAILLLLAKARASLSPQSDALGPLGEALRLAQPGGYLRIFVEEGQQIGELLSRGRESGLWCASPLGDYVAGLLSAFPGSDRGARAEA
jgi:LuxR family transcriptional regulator, maltose regulon positive regulatory protein